MSWKEIFLFLPEKYNILPALASNLLWGGDRAVKMCSRQRHRSSSVFSFMLAIFRQPKGFLWFCPSSVGWSYRDYVSYVSPGTEEGGRRSSKNSTDEPRSNTARCFLVRPSAIWFSLNRDVLASATVDGIEMSAPLILISDNENVTQLYRDPPQIHLTLTSVKIIAAHITTDH